MGGKSVSNTLITGKVFYSRELYNQFLYPQITYGIGAAFGVAACLCIYFGQAKDNSFRTIDIYGVVAIFG